MEQLRDRTHLSQASFGHLRYQMLQRERREQRMSFDQLPLVSTKSKLNTRKGEIVFSRDSSTGTEVVQKLKDIKYLKENRNGKLKMVGPQNVCSLPVVLAKTAPVGSSSSRKSSTRVYRYKVSIFCQRDKRNHANI